MKFDESDSATEGGNSNQVQSIRSRPTSLLSPPIPEKEPISFEVNLVGAPVEIQKLVEHVKVVAESFLYHWKSFPIRLPKPISSVCYNCIGTESSSERCETQRQLIADLIKCNNLRDLFITPPFDELDAVALDGKGEPKLLSNVQLRAIRDCGEFTVPSQNFPGQKHHWRLSELLQKGIQRSRETFIQDLAVSAGIIFVTAKERINGTFFSLIESLRALANGFLLLIDIFVGIPSLLAHDLDKKIKEERSKFLVAELICRPEHEECMDSLTCYVRRQLQRAATEKFDIFDIADGEVAIPYMFVTPKSLELDLRLFSRTIMRKALPVLKNIVERERRGWFLHFRERLISELKVRDKKITDTEIEEEVNSAVLQEYLQRVYSSVLNHPDLADLGDGIPSLLVQQAQSVVIMQKAYERVQKDLNRTRIEHENRLKNAYPIMSRVEPWLQSKLEAAELQKFSKCKWSIHEEALKMAQKHNLQQTAYFVSRDLTFMREREPVLLKELRKVKEPTRNFYWSCRIWSARNWIVRRNFQGFSEIIPNMICQQATSIVTPRSDPSQPIFLVEKDIIRKNSTRWPGWRLINLMQRIWCYVWNVMYLLGFVVPWDSAVSIRALFCVNPFIPQLELSQVNGTLFPRKSSTTQTLASRLLQLLRNCSKSRTRFETQPDTGFISKGVKRIWNQIWNYFFKGFIGTMLIIFGFPIICMSACFMSIFLALTAPLWIPVSVIALHLFIVLIYDIDSPNAERNRYLPFFESIVKIIAQGCIQPILCCFVGGILCPVAASVVFLFSIVRYLSRLIWDFFVFHVFIKNFGRVPSSSDSFAVKRISGPGYNILSGSCDYFFLIKPEQALAAFEAKMELEELEAFKKHTENFILQPQRDFCQFVDACFGPFSSQLDPKSGSFKNLERESHDLLILLNEKLEKRQRELQTNLSVKVKNRIRLYEMDLKITIQIAANLLERCYPKRIIDRLSVSEGEFWDSKNLQIGDWVGLAGHLYTEIFSLDFLTPLSETDTKFNLEPHPQLDLTRYQEMVQNASKNTTSSTYNQGFPDLLGNVYAAPRAAIKLQSPYLEVSAFNPKSVFISTIRKNENNEFDSSKRSAIAFPPRRRKPATQLTTQKTANNDKYHFWAFWKRKNHTNITVPQWIMLNPLPIPHPVCIAIEIYNRDAEDPINTSNDTACWDILRAMEECNKDIEASGANFVSRYRGGGDLATSGTSSIDSLDVDERKDVLEFSKYSSYGTRESVVQGTETLPCGAKCHDTTDNLNANLPIKSFQWANNWGITEGATGTVRVDLASPEDISLDTDNTSSVAYGTTV